ncbi:MAG: imidazole glycerol phosphate synthase subunit HisH [Acidimicrobiia bacterium]
MIGVIDYRAGNAPSVMYALDRLGLEARLVDEPAGVTEVDRLILPGVGAARATLASLSDSGLVEPMRARVLEDRIPFLGICIGLQVLFEHSEEGPADGLGWLPGDVRRFPDTNRVPQIGWNAVRFTRAHPVTADLPDSTYCYFVNSYYVVPTNPEDVLATTDYSVEICSVVARENLIATQFHAEKSGELGLRILRGFAAWDGGPC